MYKGTAYGEKKDYIKAIENFNKVIDLSADKNMLYVGQSMRAYAYTKMKKFDLALADYSKAIALQPNRELAYSYRGCMYVDQGKYDQAINDFNHAIQLDKKSARAYAGRAAAYQKLGRKDDARKDAEQALSLQKNNKEAVKVLKELKAK